MNQQFYTQNTPPTAQKQPPAEQKPTRYRYRPSDLWLGIVLWFVGWCYVAVVPLGDDPALSLVAQILLFVGALIYLTRPQVGGRITPFVGVLVGVSITLAISFLWTVNRAMLNSVAAWNAFCWFYTVFAMTGNSRERWAGEHFVGEVLTAALKMPYRAPGSIFGAIFGQKTLPDGTKSPKSRVRGVVGWICLGLALAVLPTVIIVSLLSFDEGFSGIIDDIMDTIFEADTLFRLIRDAAIGLLVGAILFGAVLAGREKSLKKPYSGFFSAPPQSGAEYPAEKKRADGAHRIPVPLVAAMLTPIMAVYVIFFVSQWDYYVSAFTGVRPEELTFSAYAREGFFQLVTVAVINALFSLMASTLSVRRAYDPARPRRERTSPVIRIYLGVLSLMTLVLIATALAKMLLYVGTYGLSHKRVYATWLMMLLAVSFVAVLVRQLWTRLNLTGALLAVFLSFFLAIAMAPTDALIVRYNVDAALDGNLHAMLGDVCEDSDTAGVLAALDFMEATEKPNAIPYDPADFDENSVSEIRADTDRYLARMASELGARKWYEHNITTLRAKAALRDAGYDVTPPKDD